MRFLIVLKGMSPRFSESCRRYFFSGKKSGSKKSKKYSSTLNLPQTQFPISMRDSSLREKDIQNICGFQDLYKWQRENNTGEEFILHDGPPYANGKTHVGHAINKILKDIVCRYHVLRGSRVHYVPGWDCHGLPIELKAMKNKGHLKLTPLQIRDLARQFADGAVRSQMESFKRWGVMGDWDNPYYTYNPQYEAKQLEVFLHMYEKGYIYQDVMPVYWSPSSRTALAESELEYKADHVSTSIFVKFPITKKSSHLQNLVENTHTLHAVIWTTTPWTIPANQAVCYGEDINYFLMEDEMSRDVYMCEESFTEKLTNIVGKPLICIGTILGTNLKGIKYRHPLTNEELPFLPGSHVTSDKGTGLVHTAPAHGHDDFQLAKKLGIQIRNVLDDDCRYTGDIGPQLHGKAVGHDAEQAVLDLLGTSVIHKEDFVHSYPYDWRTKKPVIIRTSRQWFIDTQALKSRALECLDEVTVYPNNLQHGMEQQLDSRTYWCISRQRVWGLPIPVFYHKQTEKPLINRVTVEHIKELVGKHGSDCWWSLSDEELLPSQLLQQNGLGSSSEDYTRGQDILDIWFDSGSSWAAVLEPDKQADVYMEGTDQFRGWFQSSLLTSVAVQDKAPYKSLVVHGFTMDEDGRKMSKSVGNVVDPDVVIHGGKNKEKEPAYGADVLRWWAAVSNLQTHSTIGKAKLDQMLGDLYELRKMLRFLLGNISTGILQEHVDYNLLWPQDKYMLYQLYHLGSKVAEFYENYDYVKLLRTVDKFCKDDVSKFYSVMVKDRCYCGEKESLPRQASLTTQYYILDVLMRSLAPILPHLAEDLYYHYPPSRRKKDVDSIFKTGWFSLPEEWNNINIVHTFEPVIDIKEHLQDIIQSEPSIEFDVMIYTSSLLYNKLQELQSEHTSSESALCEILQTASTTLTDEALTVIPDEVQAVSGICNVHMKDGFKHPEKYVIILKDTDRFICERCRRFTSESAKSPCPRCLDVLATGWEN
ncbi:isoleucine--tRNA ligase, mitochondrial-like [Mercenaria mercenaria]|uniref:isoleucine--tRNA ligase, mitochondrial-like n=1 Tax=Mercenaria mercenaria TaxID=6596 RepID=UPI00234ED8F2|nr:isoleucine--tRNA ligase, mitochondrial-like [Mercenaria mercenaria]